MQRICVLLILFSLGVTPAFADEVKYTPVNVPVCRLISTPAGGLCAFTLKEWKQVLRADAELERFKANESSLLEKDVERIKQLGLLQRQVEVYAQSQKTLVSENEKLTRNLIETDRKYQNERVKFRLGSPVAWTVAGASIAVLGGFLLKGFLD